MTRDCEVVEAQPRTPEVREVLLSNTPARKTFLIIKKSGKASYNEMSRLQSEEGTAVECEEEDSLQQAAFLSRI